MRELILEKQTFTESARDYTYRMMKNNILQMCFLPGEMLSEATAAKLLGVSRTPVHDTFARLAQEKLVNVVTQKGTEIALIDPARVRQAVFVKGELCEEVLRRLCREGIPADALFALESNHNQQYFMLDSGKYENIRALDTAFYAHCFAVCGLTKVWQVMQSVSYDMDRTQALETHTPNEWTEVVHAQTEIFNALRRHDAQAAAVQIRDVIQQVLTRLPALQKRYPAYFKEYPQESC
ncbi:MAG: GntR family transcriptional regulator [Ruthenibacterium sp.]